MVAKIAMRNYVTLCVAATICIFVLAFIVESQGEERPQDEVALDFNQEPRASAAHSSHGERSVSAPVAPAAKDSAPGNHNFASESHHSKYPSKKQPFAKKQAKDQIQLPALKYHRNKIPAYRVKVSCVVAIFLVWAIASIATCTEQFKPLETMKGISKRFEKTENAKGKEKIGLGAEQKYSNDVLKDLTFETVFDLLEDSNDDAILSTDGRKPLTYHEMKQFLASGINLIQFGVGNSDRVCVVLPNGPESATCFLGMSMRSVYAPLNINLSDGEFAFEFEDLPAKLVIVLGGPGSAVVNKTVLEVAKRMQVPVVELIPDSHKAGLFSLYPHPRLGPSVDKTAAERLSKREELALVLHTSGTTKKPKIVPLTHANICSGAVCIASTLELQKPDVNLNMMPLFHIHGISINVLASMLTGARTICTSGFHNENFFRWISEEPKPTWYSAVPTMHQAILITGEEMVKDQGDVDHTLKFFRNCSAALLPSVAARMETLFNNIAIPTYAMTESMPIASNPVRGKRNLRSVGFAAGPSMKLMDPSRDDPVPQGEEGEICVAGGNVTAGYEYRPHMDCDPNIEAFTPDRWLRTGDKGWIDKEGFLNLSGRFKEIISRGGEKIGPFEMEDAMRKHPSIRDVLAFGVPHEMLGEVVGIAAVLNPGSTLTLKQVQEHLAETGQFSANWLPESLVRMRDIPKGPTGKPARIGLAQKILHHPVLDGDESGVENKSWDFTTGQLIQVEDGDAVAEDPDSALDSLGTMRNISRSKSDELKAWDTLRFHLMVLVVLGHIFSKGVDKQLITNSLELRLMWSCISLTAMPTFIFASGYASKGFLQTNSGGMEVQFSKMQGIIVELGLSYVLSSWVRGAVYHGFDVWIGGVAGFPVMSRLENIVYNTFGFQQGLWYLASLLWWRLSMFFTKSLSYPVAITFMISFLLPYNRLHGQEANILGLREGFFYLPHFTAGVFCDEKKLMKYFRSRSIRIVAAGWLFMALPLGLVLAENYVLEQTPGAMYNFAHYRRSSNMSEGYIVKHFMFFVLTMACVLSWCVLAFWLPEHPELLRETGRNTKEAYVLHATFFLPAIAALDLSNFFKSLGMYENPLMVLVSCYILAFLVSMLTGSAFSKRIFDWLCSPWWMMDLTFANFQELLQRAKGKVGGTKLEYNDEETQGLI